MFGLAVITLLFFAHTSSAQGISSSTALQLAAAQGGGVIKKELKLTRTLKRGMTGSDVKALQEFLIGQNKGSVAEQLGAVGATGYFGALTQKTLAEYQGSIGISPAAGYFGPKTRNYINSLKNR